jgi:hypothetical protein
MGRHYFAGQYNDPETKRQRWAVVQMPSCVWYFPKRYGKTAAERLAQHMERNA